MASRLTINELLEAARSRIDRVSPADAAREMDGGALVVDTRCASQREAAGMIPGAAHIPLSVLFWRLDPASGYSDPRWDDPARRVILVCEDGYSSSLAAATLRDLGFDRAADMDGGFTAWAAASLPVERPGA